MRVRPQAGGPFLSCFYKPTRSTSPHKCTATRDQACWGAGTGGRPGRHPLGADTEPVRDRGLVVGAVHLWWVVGLAHALLSSAPWVPAGLGHTTVRVWTVVKPSGAPLRVGELGAPPRGKSKRKVSQLGQEPEAGRALDSALAGGVRGEVGLLRDPGGGPWRHIGGQRLRGKKPFSCTFNRTSQPQRRGHPGSMVLSHGLSDALRTPI